MNRTVFPSTLVLMTFGVSVLAYCVLHCIGSKDGPNFLARKRPKSMFSKDISVVAEDPHPIVFNYGTNTLSKIDLVNDAFGTTIAQSVSLGFDPAPASVRRGRGILNDADRSAGGTSSCASCHIGGHTNQTIYNLGNHLHRVVTPANQIDLWVDNKGPMVTQSLRGLPEGAPYHWRGERSDLEAFNVAFEGLLKGSQLTAGELSDMSDYISALHYPANPIQNLDRSSTPNQLEGGRIFIEELSTPNNSCAACHSLPIGGSGEVFQETNGQAQSFVVTQLRAVGDKELGKHDLGSVGGFSAGFSSEIGPSLLHTGRIGTLFDFSEAFSNIDATEAARLEDFMKGMDTGLARSSAHQATVTSQNWATFSDHLTLITAAEAGHSDLVAIGSVDFGAGGIERTSYTYNPGTGLFFPPHPSWPPLPPSLIIDLARLGYGAWTFIGTPSGMGFRKGVDLDGDALTDLLEIDHGTDPENPDTDGDGFPDGYEVAHGTNPLSAIFENPNDSTAPVITAVEVIWFNTNTIKYRIRTDEPCRVVATWNGIRGLESRTSPTFGPYEIKHTFVVNFLPDGSTTPVSFVATDPAGNSSPATIGSDLTEALQAPDKMFVQSVAVSIGPIGISMGTIPMATTNVTMTAQIDSKIGSASNASALVTGFLYFDDGNNGLQIIDSNLQATTNASGFATFNRTLTWAFLGGGTGREIYFGVTEVDSNPAILAGYSEAFDVLNFTNLSF